MLQETNHVELPSSLRLPRELKGQLFLVCGFIESGKTSLSVALAQHMSALRLTLDQWVNALYGAEADTITTFDPQARVKEVMWEVAAQALAAGLNVVLDWGFWSKTERDQYREKCRALGGCTCTLVFTDCSKEECSARIKRRNEHLTSLDVTIPLEKLERWWAMFEPPQTEEHIRVPS